MQDTKRTHRRAAAEDPIGGVIRRGAGDNGVPASTTRCSFRTVVTVERQGGYAARCDNCGDITFGGFESRTAAREAITHEVSA